MFYTFLHSFFAVGIMSEMFFNIYLVIFKYFINLYHLVNVINLTFILTLLIKKKTNESDATNLVETSEA